MRREGVGGFVVAVRETAARSLAVVAMGSSTTRTPLVPGSPKSDGAVVACNATEYTARCTTEITIRYDHEI